MSPSIYCAEEWSSPDVQYFVNLGLGSEDILLHESRKDAFGKYPLILQTRVERPSPVNVFCYSPATRGVVACGDSTGTVSVLNLFEPSSAQTFNLRYPRPCSSVAFDSSTLLATGFDRVRNDESLFIYDVSAEQSSHEPVAKYLTNEGVAAAEFITRHSLSSPLLVATYKSIREIDLRMSQPTSQIFTKFAYGLSICRSNEHVFMTSSDNGQIAYWDRRNIHSSFKPTKAAEPLLIVPRVFQDSQSKSHPAVHFHRSTSNEFAALSNGQSIRRWILSSFPTVQTASGPVSSLTSAVKTNAAAAAAAAAAASAASTSAPGSSTVAENESRETFRGYSPFIRSVRDVHLQTDKVAGFNYAVDPETNKLGFVCMRQSGQLFRAKLGITSEAVAFTPDNALQSLYDDTAWTLQVESAQAQFPEDEAAISSASDDDADQISIKSNATETVQGRSSVDLAHAALSSDVQRLICQRAVAGYGTDPSQNLELLRGEGPHGLVLAWSWLKHAAETDEQAKLVTEKFDLGYEGVHAIWQGDHDLQSPLRVLDPDSPVTLNKSINEILTRYSGTVFVSPDLVTSPQYAKRRLCLYVCGWTFPITELESKLQELEAAGQHEKAAAWAVFHGDVKRAVASLGASRKSQLRLMASAVAGYLLYKEVEINNPWRDQCRKLALEMSEPYLRAIFAYIADGSWLDVLDDSALPLTERLGIALRFLPDIELTRYLQELTIRCAKQGDLEGLVLTGLSPLCCQLLQSYVDKTSDVQTAALIGAFGSPRFFKSTACETWVMEYRTHLNSVRLFSERARFDVARTKLAAKARGASKRLPIPKQAFLQCSYCLTKFEQAEKQGQPSLLAAGNRCRNCNHPQPRCAVCSLSLGTKISENNFDRWPCFCMSCNHGFHSLHARLWFEKYTVCPVPDCTCNCGSI